MLLAAHALQRKLRKARSRIAEEDEGTPVASMGPMPPSSPIPLDPSARMPTATALLASGGQAPPESIQFPVDPLDQCTAIGVYMEAGGDADDVNCRIAPDVLWHALQKHLAIGAGSTALISGFRPSNKTRRAERRTWQLLLTRAAAAEGGVSWEAFERCWFEMEMGRQECPADLSESNAVARLSGRPITPPRLLTGSSAHVPGAALGTTRPQDDHASEVRAWHNTTVALEVKAGIDTPASVELRHRTDRVCQLHQRVLQRLRSVNLTNPEFPPGLAHLLRLDTRRLQSLVIKLGKRLTPLNLWFRALKRCVEVLAAHAPPLAPITMSKSPALTATPSRDFAAESPARRPTAPPVPELQLTPSPRFPRYAAPRGTPRRPVEPPVVVKTTPRKVVPMPPSPSEFVEAIFHRAVRRGIIHDHGVL